MNLVTVESSMIHAIGYDPQIHVLEIIFSSGGIYFYGDVPPEVFEGLMSAESKGQYFSAHIRDAFKNWTLEDAPAKPTD